MLNKKSAMFGLDARIALAIFGALSVITGAALYSVIQNAKVVSVMVTLDNITKAMDEYYLDTGSPVGHDELNYIVEDSGLNGWNGPYMQADVTLTRIFVDNMNVWGMYSTDVFGDQYSTVSPPPCGVDCEYWLKITIEGFNNQNIVKSLDDKIDGGDGFAAGKIRVLWADAEKSNNLRLFYKAGHVN